MATINTQIRAVRQAIKDLSILIDTCTDREVKGDMIEQREHLHATIATLIRLMDKIKADRAFASIETGGQ